jgi:DNA-binding CsgD family transcriptional regulator
MTEVVGREAELEALRAFLGRVPVGAAGFVLEGEAGMGKTTLWRAAVEQAEEEGLVVLQAQPVESETTLSYAGLADLLAPVLDGVLESLPAVQQRALLQALALGENDSPLDPRTLRVAVMSALRSVAEERPVLLAIDDSQWLDHASSAALAYGTRRFRSEPIGLLLSRRFGLESILLEELLRSPAGGLFTRIEVGVLDVQSLGRAVQHQLGSTLPRPLLAEVHEAAGGNPFYALEIVRTLKRTGASIEAGSPMPLPDTLQKLVRDRVLALPPESRAFLLAVAAHAQPTVAIAEAASGVERGTGLAPALDVGVVELDGERIRFTHPLLAAGVYESANPLRRTEIHARLAELLDDPEARAWQLAAAATGPDEHVAAALADAAQHALARGAPRLAALLLERAAGLTSDHDAAHGWNVNAAYAHHAAGDTERARVLLDDALVRASARERAGLLVALARVRSYDDDIRGANALYRQALAEAEDGSLVEAYAQEGLGGTLFRLRESLGEAVDVSGSAAVIARKLPSAQLEAEALATKAVCEAALGRLEASETASAAAALAKECLDRPILRQPGFAATVVRFWHGDLAGARERYAAMAADAKELGDESSLPYVHVMLSQIECARGSFQQALREAEEARLSAELAGQRTVLGYALGVRAIAEAHLGDVAAARESADQALELARQTSGVPAWIFATWAAGQLELARGDAAAAATALRQLLEHHMRESICEPGALPFLPDAVEALITGGELDQAASILDWYAEASARLDRPRAIAVGRRLRGLLLAAHGDLEGALEESEQSVVALAAADDTFERARSLLALGVAQRRAKRRREARATLEEALAVFERIGAALWAERARNELKRISGRAATPGALTPAEERVAILVAEGRTNKEVAAALFLSERTVEGHLAHIFGKLGVRNRREIASVLALTQTQVTAPPNTGDSPVSAESPAP